MLLQASQLESIRRRYPSLRITLLSYLSDVCLDVILRTCWPGFEWDLIAAPLAAGLPCAWRLPAADKPEKMLYIGSTLESIRFAHSQPGCFSVLAIWGWNTVPYVRFGYGDCAPSRWKALSLFADAQVDEPDEIESFIAAPEEWLPLLESLQESSDGAGFVCRYLVCNKFNNEEGGKARVRAFNCS